MKTICITLLILMSLPFAVHAKTLKVLSYNIKGLPKIAGGYSHNRFKDIGQVLFNRKLKKKAPHVVLLQESFIGETKWLRDRAQYPYVSQGPQRCGKLLNGERKCAVINSGLYILSEYPIVVEKQIVFSKGMCGHFDCFANKGIQMVAIKVPGLSQPLKIYNTHMQAHDEYEGERMKQNSVIREFLLRTNPQDESFIFAGDFNFKPRLDSYHDFVEKTQLTNAGKYCLENAAHCQIDPMSKPGKIWKSTVDHHFINNKQDFPFYIEAKYIEKNFKTKINGRMPSDHDGYEVHYEIR